MVSILLGLALLCLFLGLIYMCSRLEQLEHLQSRISCLERKYLELTEHLLNERINRTTD